VDQAAHHPGPGTANGIHIASQQLTDLQIVMNLPSDQSDVETLRSGSLLL
jgi:hypothetical protein